MLSLTHSLTATSSTHDASSFPPLRTRNNAFLHTQQKSSGEASQLPQRAKQGVHRRRALDQGQSNRDPSPSHQRPPRPRPRPPRERLRSRAGRNQRRRHQECVGSQHACVHACLCPTTFTLQSPTRACGIGLQRSTRPPIRAANCSASAARHNTCLFRE
jgi:hypothetical protein